MLRYDNHYCYLLPISDLKMYILTYDLHLIHFILGVFTIIMVVFNGIIEYFEESLPLFIVGEFVPGFRSLQITKIKESFPRQSHKRSTFRVKLSDSNFSC